MRGLGRWETDKGELGYKVYLVGIGKDMKEIRLRVRIWIGERERKGQKRRKEKGEEGKEAEDLLALVGWERLGVGGACLLEGLGTC